MKGNKMNTTSLAIKEQQTSVQSIETLQSQINDIRRLMKSVMKEGVHYGVIGGTKQPTLYKAGAEILIAYFGLSFRTMVDSEERDEDKYYVRIKSQLWKGDKLLGEAFGEASTQEEKYLWRMAVCDEEWDSTPEDKRRIAFKRWDRTVRKIKQVKVPVADISNTVLKMAVKRAMVAVVRMVCGASEVWTEDLEDMPQEIVESLVNDNQVKVQEPQPKVPEPKEEPEKPNTISEKQRKRLFALAHEVGMSDDLLKDAVRGICGVEHTHEITKDKYEELCEYIQAYTKEQK